MVPSYGGIKSVSFLLNSHDIERLIMMNPQVQLADMIAALREQLVQAQAQGSDSPVRFDVAESEVEVQFTVAYESDGKAGIRFWVVEAGGGASVSAESVQRLRLKLLPVDAAGETARISDSGKRSS